MVGEGDSDLIRLKKHMVEVTHRVSELEKAYFISKYPNQTKLTMEDVNEMTRNHPIYKRLRRERLLEAASILLSLVEDDDDKR